MDYRTKPSVAAGVCGLWGDQFRGWFVDYQPGNGTRYLLALHPMPSQLERSHDFGIAWSIYDQPGWLLSKVNGSSGAMTVTAGPGSFLHWSTVAQYMGMGKADAVVVTELVGNLLGISCTTTPSAKAEDGEAAVSVEDIDF